MTKQTKATEVVKMRIGVETKKQLEEIADREFRSFSDQCRLALSEWIKTKNGGKS